MLDGSTVESRVADAPDALATDADHWVTVTFRQVTSAYGRTTGAMDAVQQVLKSTPGLLTEDPDAAPGTGGDAALPELKIAYTVVDAVTADIDEGGDQVMFEAAQELPPSADPFNRCLRLVQDLARAHRALEQGYTRLPTYERLNPQVLMFQTQGELVDVHEDGRSEVIVGVPDSGWTGPNLMMLDHFNMPDPVPGALVEGERADQLDLWLDQVRLGNPLLRALEGFVEARRALDVEGDYAAAVVLAETASEVFVDGVIALLLWELGVDPHEAAGRFEVGKVTRRVRTDLPTLLGGLWRLDGGNGVAETWMRDTVRLRHRVVHGGYRPSRIEAAAAVRGAVAFERHLYDRLADRRNQYPRSALMALAEPGLTARGMWGGKIKQFAETVGPTEPSWHDGYAAWRGRMVAALVAST